MKLMLDFETTGFSSSKCSIIEIGAVKFNGETFEIIDKFNRVVIPDKGYAQWYEEGSLSREFVQENGIPLELAMELFHAFVGDVTVADFYAYNSPFDEKFYNKSVAKYPGDYMVNWTCVLKMARKHLYLEKNTLEDVCKHYGIDIENAHRALDDCVNTLEVLKRIVKGE